MLGMHVHKASYMASLMAQIEEAEANIDDMVVLDNHIRLSPLKTHEHCV